MYPRRKHTDAWYAAVTGSRWCMLRYAIYLHFFFRDIMYCIISLLFSIPRYNDDTHIVGDVPYVLPPMPNTGTYTLLSIRIMCCVHMFPRPFYHRLSRCFADVLSNSPYATDVFSRWQRPVIETLLPYHHLRRRACFRNHGTKWQSSV